MMAPKVNINGTAREDLVNQRRAISDACLALIRVLMQAAPNGRDYIGNRDQFERDRATHFERIEQIKALNKNVTLEALAILGADT